MIPDDDRFADQLGTIQSIATSHGQGDSGLFELNFNDERFLPFEGAGAISTWEIKMPREHNQFDFSTISDFILHIQYTARDGGSNLGTAAKTHLDTVLPTKGIRLISLKHEFPSEWHRFLCPNQAGDDQEFRFEMKKDHFPFYARRKNINVSKVDMILDGKHKDSYWAKLRLPSQPSEPEFEIERDDTDWNNYHHVEKSTGSLPPGEGEWLLHARRDSAGSGDFKSLPTDDLNDIFFVIHFSLSDPAI